MTPPGLLLLCAPFMQPQTADPWPALERAEWDAFAYEVLPDEGHGDFVVAGQLRASGPNAQGRLLLCLADEQSYYAVDITPAAVRVLRVESGLTLPIGATQPTDAPGRKWREFLVRREGDCIRVFVDGQVAAGAADGTYSGGKVAVGSLGDSVAFRDVLQQDTVPAYLEDDFMRAEGETGGWEIVRGQWQVQSLGSPVRSNNAFNFTSGAAPKGAVAICGDWFWHDYESSASCQPHGEVEVGLYAHYVSPKEHVAFRLGRSVGNEPSMAQLVRVRRGKSRVLASRPMNLAADQWYRLGLTVAQGRLTGTVDGHPLVEAATDVPPCGRAGLYARGGEGATFDDFSVHQAGAVVAGVPHPGVWHAVGGSWETLSEESAPSVHVVSASAAKLLYGDRLADDVSLAAHASRPSEGEVGLVAAWEDERNYDALTYGGTPAQLRLVRVVEGEPTVLSEATVDPAVDPVRLELILRGHAITGRIPGLQEIHARRNGARNGRVGLLVRDGEATFESVQVRHLPPIPEVAHFDGTFQQEVSMADWAAETSDWVAVEGEEGSSSGLYWHRAPAYGAQELSVAVVQPPAGPISVVLSGEEPTAQPGYRFTIAAGQEGAARLYRAGSEVAAEKLPNLAAEGIREVGLGKQGDLLVGSLNRQPLVVFDDPQPASGLHSGWAAPEGVTDPAQTTFRAENVLSYSFRRAPADWWTGSGEWKVTNRWDCEPRWTFFIGQADPIACLWNKREFGPDLTLDFYAATRFDSTKGYQYAYAADLNCTIAADGQDLTSGYSFMFGGWDNQYTRLLKGTQVLAETTEHVIPRSSSIHRQWFNLRVQKAGPRIRCWMDGTPLFDVTDPEPLSGSRVALWTYNNGMAVARVRIASSDIRPGALTPPTGPPRSPYDDAVAGVSDG